MAEYFVIRKQVCPTCNNDNTSPPYTSFEDYQGWVYCGVCDGDGFVEDRVTLQEALLSIKEQADG